MTLSEVEFRYESMLDEYPDTAFGFGPVAHKMLVGWPNSAICKTV